MDTKNVTVIGCGTMGNGISLGVMTGQAELLALRDQQGLDLETGRDAPE